MKPTIGQIVHVNDVVDRGCRAAIITHVWSDISVNLTVFDPFVPQAVYGKTSHLYNEDHAQPGWHWPEGPTG